MIYLASPYSHIDPEVRQWRYETVRDFVAHHMQNAPMPIYSPIVYGHYMAKEKGMPFHKDFWHRHNTSMLRRCEIFWGMKLPGWDESAGCKIELNMAENLLMSIHYIDEYGDFIL